MSENELNQCIGCESRFGGNCNCNNYVNSLIEIEAFEEIEYEMKFNY